MKIFTGLYRISILILALTLLLTACSKSSGTVNNSSYYMTAMINNLPWAANTSNNSFKSPALAGLKSQNGTTIVLVIGIKAVNTDTSGFAVIFPQNITLNQTFAFDPSQLTESVFINELSPGSATYNTFNTTATTGGSGSFTITVFDQTAKIIESSFSGTYGSAGGSNYVVVSNGKFRCPYTTDITEINNMSGGKF